LKAYGILQLKLKVLPKPTDTNRCDSEQDRSEYAIQGENRFQALNCLEEESTPNEAWQQVKDTLLQVVEKTFFAKNKNKNKKKI